MRMKLKYSSKDEKNKKTEEFEYEYLEKKNSLETILSLVFGVIQALPILWKIVVKIVELIMNRLFYYCCNNRFFIMFWDRNIIKPPAMRVRAEEAIALRKK